MKKILIIICCSILLTSCVRQISQNVYYTDETNGLYCVNTYSNGLGGVPKSAFNITWCNITEEKIDSAKKEQYKLAQKFIKILQ